jgi:hypothetical protein
MGNILGGGGLAPLANCSHRQKAPFKRHCHQEQLVTPSQNYFISKGRTELTKTLVEKKEVFLAMDLSTHHFFLCSASYFN